jgi:hypothetical protein
MIGGRSRARKISQRETVPTDQEDQSNRVAEARYIQWWLIGPLVLLIGFPLVVLGIYCANLSTGGLSAYAAAIMVAAACCLAGSLLGFLFGIPRALSGDAAVSADMQHNRLITNTNLEQVSDWLTKIIVGATLVQLGPLLRGFRELATFLSGIFGAPSAQNKALAGAIILYNSVFGFFAMYIAARSIITFLFNMSPDDWFSKGSNILAKQDTGKAEGSQDLPSVSTKPDDLGPPHTSTRLGR